jgi:hypothetical protein
MTSPQRRLASVGPRPGSGGWHLPTQSDRSGARGSGGDQRRRKTMRTRGRTREGGRRKRRLPVTAGSGHRRDLGRTPVGSAGFVDCFLFTVPGFDPVLVADTVILAVRSGVVASVGRGDESPTRSAGRGLVLETRGRPPATGWRRAVPQPTRGVSPGRATIHKGNPDIDRGPAACRRQQLRRGSVSPGETPRIRFSPTRGGE